LPNQCLCDIVCTDVFNTPADFDFKHGKINISGSGSSSENAQISSESREAVRAAIVGPLDSLDISIVLQATGNDATEDAKSYLESEETVGTTPVGPSDPPRISKISDTDLLSVISEPKISNLTAISHVSSRKKEEILSSALVHCSSPGKTEVSASLSRAEQEVDNFVKIGDEPLLPTSSLVARNLVEVQINAGGIKKCRRPIQLRISQRRSSFWRKKKKKMVCGLWM
jgi:hypothetical protein